MQTTVSASPAVVKQRTLVLSRTWFFRITSFALIGLVVPTLANYLRGMVGFVLLIGFAVFVALLENSFNYSLYWIRAGISRNKWLFLFAVWYLVGLVMNIFFRGGRGLDDWRLMMSPLVFFIGMAYAFAFARDSTCYRYFQIGFLVVMGIQSVFMARELSRDVGIAREMLELTQGTWIYGNQHTYAILAMLLPILIWRSLQERGVLKVLLVVGSLTIGISTLISSFATPVGALLIGGIVVVATLVIVPPKGISRWRGIWIASAIVFLGTLVGQFKFEILLLDPVYYRIENLIRDPLSGGYSESLYGASRWYLAEISVKSFLDEPFLGAGGGSVRHSEFVGGHSSFFDALGAYGLLGGGGALAGMILVMFLTAAVRFWRERSWETLVGLSAVTMLVVAGIVNPYWEGYEPVLALIMARPFWRANQPDVDKGRI